jgi:ribonucleases P/MRP protein subunit RPP40
MESRGGKTLTCMFANVRSIVSITKRAELELYVDKESPDIIGIAESWTKPEISDGELALEGYQLFRLDRANQKAVGHGAGGVLLYVKDNINAMERCDMKNEAFKESVWCEIQFNKSKMLVGVCYRVPDATEEADQGLHALLEKANKETALIMGDFNYHIDWIKMEGERKEDRIFVDFIEACFMQQYVMEPTRGDQILDLIIASEENMVEMVSVGEHFGTSDHQVVRWELVMEQTQEVKAYVRRPNFFKADYELVRKKLREKDLVSAIQGLEVNDAWRKLRELMTDIIVENIPMLKRTNKRRPWVTREVQRKRRAKNKAWKNFQKLKKETRNVLDLDHECGVRLENLRNRYVEKRNTCNEANKEAIKNFEQKLSRNVKEDCKSFYNYVRSKQRRKDRIGPLRKESDAGEVIVDDVEAAEVLNKYFSSVFTLEKLGNIPEPKKTLPDNEAGLTQVSFTKESVVEQLSRLKVGKSPGIDELHPKFLLEVREEIGEALAQIFNKSIQTGDVPQEWRDALIVPLFKKGSRSEPGNYRPVSLTSVVCKIMEKIIKNNIVEKLNEHNIIRDSQHGFTKGRSCLTNLLEFFEEVYERIDEGKPVDVIYLDFAKAFDKVPHVRLAKKLQACGIRGQVLTWIQSWLSGRRQKVGIGDKHSRWETVLSGVPQGSVLGPLLFVIFINDIDDGILSKISKFADDTKLCRGVGDDEDAEILREDLRRMFRWSQDWQMLFNVEKCSVMHMGKRNKEYSYEMGGKVLKVSEEERDLGVIMHKSAKPSRQCAEASKKANSTLGMIKRTIVTRDKDTILRLYKSLVRPQLEYCVQAWNPYLKQDIEKLEKVQRRATKMISGYKNLSYEERLAKCGLTTLEWRRSRGDLIEAYKIITGKEGIPWERFFELAPNKATRGHRYKLFKKPRGTIGQRFFSARVVEMWNGLDDSAVSVDTITAFKVKLGKLGY